MQRIVEQPSDTGEMFAGRVSVGRVHYHLSVYQHFSETEDEVLPPNLEVEGRIAPLDDLDLVELRGRGSEFTLRLADGRSLDLSMTDEEGRVRSTGRGLYRE
jgi:hypothetical protein